MSSDTTITTTTAPAPATPVATRVATEAPGAPARPQRNAMDLGVPNFHFNDNDDAPRPVPLRRMFAFHHGNFPQRPDTDAQNQPGFADVARRLFANDDDVPTDVDTEDEGEARDPRDD